MKSNHTVTELNITGMTCAACSARIEKVIGKMNGVMEANVNLAMETANISYNADHVRQEDLIAKIASLGYGANIKEAAAQNKQTKAEELNKKKTTS